MQDLTIRGMPRPESRRLRTMPMLIFACVSVCMVPSLPASAGTGPQAQQTGAAGGRAGQEETPELPLLEEIRGDKPERLFELLRQGVPLLPQERRLALEAMARYRLADFDAVRALLAKMDIGAAESLLLQALLGAVEGRFREAEGLVSAALARRSDLGLLAFEAGLLHSYLLQHLGKHRQAAGVIEQLLAEAPFGRSALRSIQKSLEISPEEPYRIKAVAADHAIPLLADGSLPPRTVLELHPGEPGRLVLFDTGSSLTLLKV
ncbi:MAG: hypothetical protein HYX74_00955, partial [Acidobacteria bacterium]|nr:hypothetical protein [Acidobacteriota bacterium]